MATRTFAERFEVARTRFGPLVFGLDPSASVLASWGLDDDAGGLERFADITLEATVGAVGMVKPQAAFFERHGWRGMKVLDRLVRSARSSGLLVILDAKRGDVGSTNDAYACAYLGEGAAMQVDALTLSPYLGVEAMGAFFDAALAAGSALFVVARSSNLEGRALQEAILSRPAAAGSAGEVSPVGAAGPAPAVGGLTVEQSVLASIAARNQQVAPGGVGPFGAVIGATHQAAGELDLVRMGGLLLSPGLGAQGAGPADVARTFASCPDRILPSASRSLLAAGPTVARLREALHSMNRALVDALDQLQRT